MFRKRILAFIIDDMLVITPCLLLSLVYIFDQKAIDTSSFAKTFYIIYLLSMVWGSYGIIFKDLLGGRSLGKKLLRLSIYSKNGSKPTILQLLIRNLFLIIWPVELMLLLFDKTRIGDKIAKTIVV